MNTKCVPVILSGGAGTRLWPLSRHYYPKQFIPLFDNKNLFTRTIERIMPLDPEHIVVVCNEQHRFMVLEHLHAAKVKSCTIIAEPASHNTAPAIALAAFCLSSLGSHFEDSPMLVLPSDHYMEEDGFSSYINDELIAAAADDFITFGIQPTRAETGYGYIEIENRTTPVNDKEKQSNSQLANVLNFIEKPALEDAKKYIETGSHYWNSGIFLLNIGHYLSALQHHQADIYEASNKALSKGRQAVIDGYSIMNPNSNCFSQNPDISIDYAVMERVNNIRLCPLNVRWSDLGTWQALSETQNTDDSENILSGDGNIVVQDSKDNIVYAGSRLVACLGIENQLIAETKDAILVADRSRGQEIKQLVNKLRTNEYKESDLHAKVYRPWGSYESVDQGANFQVKRIIVKPGHKLSLQSHRHRAEHWVVVKGSAKVTLNDEVLDLQVNQSVYIPIGAKHRLENESTTEFLHLVEVQCGNYLGEDDIVRYEDNYGRVHE